jgi:hypothetical protein
MPTVMNPTVPSVEQYCSIQCEAMKKDAGCRHSLVLFFSILRHTRQTRQRVPMPRDAGGVACADVRRYPCRGSALP